MELGTVVVDGVCDPTAQVRIPLATVNRHGLVAGATGTGKTKSLQVIAEQLSAAGVPVLMADVKGDLSGLSRPGESNDKTQQRAKDTGDDWTPTAFPVEFLTLGTSGIGVPVRATVTSFGPILLSKVLGLNPTQESTLGLIFHWADQKGYALLDLKDLQEVIKYFFFDEAHLLFADASKAFLEQVEQTVKLIRSKGVGVFFCTQLPTDVPNDVLSQLGARIQHALRAFTPDDQKALTKTVRTYPKTDVYDLESALTSLGIGEAIVTVLSEKGAPTPVAWTRMRAPRSLMDTIGPDAIAAAAKASPQQAEYGQTIDDPNSAYEKLNAKYGQPTPESAPVPPPVPEGLPPAEGEVKSRDTAEPSMFEKVVDSPAFKSAMRSAGTVLGREITRSIFGTRRR